MADFDKRMRELLGDLPMVQGWVDNANETLEPMVEDMQVWFSDRVKRTTAAIGLSDLGAPSRRPEAEIVVENVESEGEGME